MKAAWEVIRQASRQWLQDGAFVLAAALAFYGAVSLAPMVMISLSFASAFYGEEALRGELVAQIDRYIGRAGAEVIQAILANARTRASGWSAIISGLVLLAGASAVFSQLQTALNRIWNVAPEPGRPWTHFVKIRVVSVGLVFGLGLLLLAFTVGGALVAAVAGYFPEFAAPGAELLWQATNFVFGVGIFGVLFAAVFKFLPDAIIRWRDVFLGALITSILFNLGRLAIGLYLGKSAPGSAYGTAGSLIALLLWLYYTALIFLFGAELTQVLAQRLGRRIAPARHAYRTSVVAVRVDENGQPILQGDACKKLVEPGEMRDRTP